MILFTAAFWKYAGERAIKSFTQALLAGITVTGMTGVWNTAWISVLSAAALTAVVSILTSVVAIQPPTPAGVASTTDPVYTPAGSKPATPAATVPSSVATGPAA
jgi:hypothetical protein